MTQRAWQIWNAVKGGYQDQLEVFLKGADRADLRHESQFPGGWNFSFTALMIASWEGKSNMIKPLVKAGADVDHQGSGFGSTALMLAAAAGHTAIVEILLQLGANVNLQDALWRSALMDAAGSGRKETVRLLLEWKADPNLHTQLGWCALIHAAQMGHKEVVQLLLDWGANKNMRLVNGQGAAEVAHTPEIRALILNHVFTGLPPTRSGKSAAAAGTGGAAAGKGESAPLPSPQPTPAATPAPASTATATATQTGTSDPALLTASQVADAESAELEGECDTFCKQVGHSLPEHLFTQQTEALRERLTAAKAERNLELAVSAGSTLQALRCVSEQDCLALVERHSDLLDRVETKAWQLVEGELYQLAGRLSAKLAALRALDMSPFMPEGACDPVHVEGSGGNSTATKD